MISRPPASKSITKTDMELAEKKRQEFFHSHNLSKLIKHEPQPIEKDVNEPMIMVWPPGKRKNSEVDRGVHSRLHELVPSQELKITPSLKNIKLNKLIDNQVGVLWGAIVRDDVNQFAKEAAKNRDLKFKQAEDVA